MTTLTGPLPLSDDHPDELLARAITPPIQTDGLPFEEVHEIERTKQLLKEGKFRTVALQFPDDILHDAAKVSRRIQDGMEGVKTYILADTSYGSCCVDEVAAEHINADVVVHYGRACLSPVTRLPAIYVFGRRTVDIESLVTQFSNAVPDKQKNILLMCDTSYVYSLDPIFDRLQSQGYISVSKHPTQETTHTIQPNSQPPQPLLPPTTPLQDTILLLIAEPKDSTATLLTYHHLTNQIYTYSPETVTLMLSSPTTNLALRRRYVAVQKARDAGTVGIIIGTLGKGGYLSLISLLRKMCLERGKKPYLLSLGKLNPAKVANFAECDVFCIIACPDSTEYFKPIVTPYELYLALTAHADGAPEWGNEWISDFAKVMTLDTTLNDDEEDVPHFSLVTGKLVYSEQSRPVRKIQRSEIEYDTNNALVKSERRIAVREDGTVAVGGVRTLAGEKLISRSWRGLEAPSASDDGAEIEIGRDGVARAYHAHGSIS